MKTYNIIIYKDGRIQERLRYLKFGVMERIVGLLNKYKRSEIKFKVEEYTDKEYTCIYILG